MTNDDIRGYIIVMAITAFIGFLGGLWVSQVNWNNGCERECLPFAIDRHRTMNAHTCRCLTNGEQNE
jgi:hypothetical protein